MSLFDFLGGSSGGIGNSLGGSAASAAGGAASAGLGLASNAALTGGLGGVGLAVSAVGSLVAASYGQDIAKAQAAEAQSSMQIAGYQQQIQTQNQQQASLMFQRQQIENVRNVQRARAAGLSTAASQGAQFGSGLAGAQAQASDQGAVNSVSNSQNFQIGSNIFGLNTQIGTSEIAIAQEQQLAANYQGKMAMWQGVAGVGSGMMGGAGSFGKLLGSG